MHTTVFCFILEINRVSDGMSGEYQISSILINIHIEDSQNFVHGKQLKIEGRENTESFEVVWLNERSKETLLKGQSPIKFIV
jgi:hypothetical protein